MKSSFIGWCFLLICFSRCSADIDIRSSPGVGVVSEDHPHDDHEAFDQEVLTGALDQRKKFQDLTPAETEEEIRKLVRRADSNGDGQLNKQELVAWLKRSEDKTYREEAVDLFKQEDTNGDGTLSFSEYWTNSEGEEVGEGELSEAQRGIKMRFDDADLDDDGLLDFEEFVPFVHPFRHDHMIGHLVEDQLGMYDGDKDGYISLEEYINSFNPHMEMNEDDPTESVQDWAEEERVHFQEYDKNRDGRLDHQEIGEWLAPNEMAFFEEEANHLLSHADSNEDGYLTVAEIQGEFDAFADSPLTNYGHLVHDEL